MILIYQANYATCSCKIDVSFYDEMMTEFEKTNLCIKKYERLLQPYDDDETKALWLKVLNDWLLGMALGLKMKPLLVCGDYIEAFTGLFTIISLQLYACKKITLVSNSKDIMNGKFSMLFDYYDNIRESQANLVVLLDNYNITKYEDIISRYRNSKTNVLIFADFESYVHNEYNEELVILTTRKRQYAFSFNNWNTFIDEMTEDTDDVYDEVNKMRKLFVRTVPHTIESNDVKSKSKVILNWFNLMYRHVERTDTGLKIPLMKRLDVSVKKTLKWINDIDMLKDELARYNLIVFDFNNIDVAYINKIYAQIVKADPSGDCLIIYIVPRKYGISVNFTDTPKELLPYE